MSRNILGLLVGLAAIAAPAAAVGLGPLSKEGMTDGPKKGFYLTVMNPYAEVARFTTEAIGYDDELPEGRVTIFPATMELGGGQNRQILVVARDLVPGETFKFRVCAERAQPPAGVQINARVCSKLIAHRLPVDPAGHAREG